VPSFEKLRAACHHLSQHGYPAASAVIPLLDAANNDLATAQKNVEAWFDATMDRVSGWYKSHAQEGTPRHRHRRCSLLNVDTIETRKQLAGSAQLRAALLGVAAKVVETKRSVA